MTNTISWSDMAPYVAPPVVAGVSIVPVFRDFMAKSAQQLGEPVPKVSFMTAFKEGRKVAPTVGGIIAAQMFLQGQIEEELKNRVEGSFEPKLLSAAVVGTCSSPIVAAFNGQTAGWSIEKSIRRFRPLQAGAVSVQETAFVFGLSAGEKVADVVKSRFGDHRAIDYGATFLSGAMGSLAGHPANTALTRWQHDLVVESFQQSMWGAVRKARATGIFALFFKIGKEFSA